MKCNKVHNQLIFFLEGELSAVEMKSVQEHLDTCSDCALFLEEMKKTLSILETEKTASVNPFFYTRVKAKLENQQEVGTLTGRRPVFVKLLQPIAFSIILLLGIYAGIKIGASSAQPENYYTEQQEIIPYLNEMDVEPIENFLLE